MSFKEGGVIRGSDLIPVGLDSGYVISKSVEQSSAMAAINMINAKLHFLHTELYNLYRNDPRAYARIGKLWIQIDMLEDAKRVRNRGK